MAGKPVFQIHVYEDSALISIEIADDDVTQALSKLSDLDEITHSILDQIGDFLIDTTKQRFATSTAPDGTPWASNSQVTILQYLRRKSGIYEGKQRVGTKDGFFYQKDDKRKRKGKLAAEGVNTVMSKKPLIGETGLLASQIFRDFDSDGSLIIGSTRKYAAVQQFGASKRQFGNAPWGDIPARPFLGLSEQDKGTILDIISLNLMQHVQP
jgi:phage gpG-like protein